MDNKEQRRKEIQEGLALNSLDGAEPSLEAKAIYEEYINGSITFEELKLKLINRYRKDK